MKTIWTDRVVRTTSRYGELAPTAAVCCNACRTCVTTNAIALATAAVAAAGMAIASRVRRFASTS